MFLSMMNGSLVNTDHVSEITARREADKSITYHAWDRDGKRIGEVPHNTYHWLNGIAAIVPNTNPDICVVVVWDDGGYEKFAVIAWKVDVAGYTMPICPECEEIDEHSYAIAVTINGATKYHVPLEGTFDTLEEFLASVKKEKGPEACPSTNS